MGKPTAVSPRKRNWSSTLTGVTPLSHCRSKNDQGFANDFSTSMTAFRAMNPSGGGVGLPGQIEDDHESPTLRALLSRYHSLALTHLQSTKKRRLESHRRSVLSAQRVANLTTLHRMAKDTLDYCDTVLRSEEEVRRASELERDQYDEEYEEAFREQKLAEDFLKWADDKVVRPGYEGGKDAGIYGGVIDFLRRPSVETKSANDSDQDPLKKTFPDEKNSTHIIDCTDKNVSPHDPPRSYQKTPSSQPHIGVSFPSPTRIPLTSITLPHNEQAAAEALAPSQRKRSSRRIYLSKASLSHVNGTYIQEGTYNDAPLFVRVGPPRKFMGKFECAVVLRRELPAPSSQGQKSSGGTFWKVGLVPAHQITHPRLIGYYIAKENVITTRGSKMPKPIPFGDMMEEDDAFYEPPVKGWKVCNESSSMTGQASNLKISYEE